MHVLEKLGAHWRSAAALLALALLLAGCGWLQDGAGVAGPGAEPGSSEAAAAASGAGTGDGGSAGAAGQAPGASLEVKPLPGYLAADFRGRDVRTGEVVTLSDLRGTPVFLNFWATWCPPCRDEMPEMEEFHREMGDAVRVVAVGMDPADSPEKMAAFAESLGLTFFVVHDGGSAARAYRVGALPTSFFIDADGVIQVRHTGALTLEQMKEYAELASNTAEDRQDP